MASYPAFLFYPEDFATGTAHMSPLAVGVYIRCLCHQWGHGFIPNDQKQIARLTGAMLDELAEAWPMVAGKFNEAEPGKLTNKRLEETRAELMRISKKRSRAGKLGAKSKWGDGKANGKHGGKRMANAKQSDDKTMASRVEDDNDNEPEAAIEKEGDDFEIFWKAFPSGRKKTKGKARTAFVKASAKAATDVIISAAAEYSASPEGRGEYVKMPETWLNGECWADDREAWKKGGSDGRQRTIGPGQRHDPAAAKSKPGVLGF